MNIQRNCYASNMNVPDFIGGEKKPTTLCQYPERHLTFIVNHVACFHVAISARLSFRRLILTPTNNLSMTLMVFISVIIRSAKPSLYRNAS